MTIEEILEERLEKSPAGLLKQIGAALGVSGRAAIMQLVREDPEARRLVQKIFKGQASITAPRPRTSGGAAKDVEF